MEKEFSVAQFFADGEWEFVRRWVDAKEAAEAAAHYSSLGAAQAGMVMRVIITDCGDCITWEWKYGEGVVFPRPS